jgi:AP-1 complex subunit sigma 1/2
MISSIQINFILLVSRQGKTRLTKWFVPMSTKVINTKGNQIVT